MLTIDNYNVGVKGYIKKLFDNTVWGNPSEAFKNAAREGGDKLSLPLVSVYRSDLGLAASRNFAAFKTGAPIKVTETKVTRERVLPFILSYQIDVWAVEEETATALFSELLFRLIDEPAVPIQHPGMEEPVINYLEVIEVMDNSDISQIATRGRLHRYTIICQMNAHIAKIVEKDRIYIIPEFYTFDGVKLDKEVT